MVRFKAWQQFRAFIEEKYVVEVTVYKVLNLERKWNMFLKYKTTCKLELKYNWLQIQGDRRELT